MCNKTYLLILASKNDLPILQKSMSEKYKVVYSENITSTIDIVRLVDFDLVICSDSPEQKSGIDNMLKIINDRYIPCILIVDSSYIVDRKKISIGLKDYVRRPFHEKEITTLSENLIKRNHKRKLSEANLI